MADSFSEQLWAEAAPTWAAIRAHPFIGEARAGTLPLESFRYYVTQDYHYLEAFARAVATALAKAPDGETLERLAKRVLTPVERPLHRRLFEMAGLDPAEVRRAEIAPSNLAYQNHMLAVAARGGLGEIAAALLPCPWTYHLLGDDLREVAPHPVYAEWASFYTAGLLADSVAAWRGFVDRCAADGGDELRTTMRRAFLTSFKYEWLFWEMGYRRESWPV
jgi:thiaminase (transcriptional activator TenA)